MIAQLLTAKLFSESTHHPLAFRGFRPNQRPKPNNFGIMVKAV